MHPLILATTIFSALAPCELDPTEDCGPSRVIGVVEPPVTVEDPTETAPDVGNLAPMTPEREQQLHKRKLALLKENVDASHMEAMERGIGGSGLVALGIGLPATALAATAGGLAMVNNDDLVSKTAGVSLLSIGVASMLSTCVVTPIALFTGIDRLGSIEKAMSDAEAYEIRHERLEARGVGF